MFLPIRGGIAKAKEEIKMLGLSNESHEMFLISVEYLLGLQIVKDKDKEVEAKSAKRLACLVNEECHTDLEPGGKSTVDPCKRPREPTESLEKPATKKTEEKRLNASEQPTINE